MRIFIFLALSVPLFAQDAVHVTRSKTTVHTTNGKTMVVQAPGVLANGAPGLTQLSKELEALAAKILPATATVALPKSGGSDAPFTLGGRVLDAHGRLLPTVSVYGSGTGGTGGVKLRLQAPSVLLILTEGSTAVLVGSPPRLVAPTTKKTLSFTLHDGTKGVAKLLASDDDLGLGIYALPAEIAKGRRGLEASDGWRVPAGRLALALSGDKGLALAVSGGVTSSALLRAADAGKGAALFDVQGRLLGLGYRGGDSGASVWSYPVPTAGKHDLYIPGAVIGRFVKNLNATGRLHRSYAGIVLGAGNESGVVVSSVLPGSPAADAGLKAGDRVSAANAIPVTSPEALARLLLYLAPGSKVPLRVGDRTVDVLLKDRSQAEGQLVSAEDLGLTCQDLTADLRTFLDLPADLRGVLVQKVAPNSRAALGGLQRGDVIVGGGGGAISDCGELQAAIASSKGTLGLRVVRGAETNLSLRVALPAGQPRRSAH